MTGCRRPTFIGRMPCDISRHAGSSSRQCHLRWSTFAQEQRKTAMEQRQFSLFHRRPKWWQPRISAENEVSLADNLRKEQRKQREAPTSAKMPLTRHSTHPEGSSNASLV